MLWFANDKTLINIAATIAVIHSTGPQAQKIQLMLKWLKDLVITYQLAAGSNPWTLLWQKKKKKTLKDKKI